MPELQSEPILLPAVPLHSPPDPLNSGVPGDNLGAITADLSDTVSLTVLKGRSSFNPRHLDTAGSSLLLIP